MLLNSTLKLINTRDENPILAVRTERKTTTAVGEPTDPSDSKPRVIEPFAPKKKYINPKTTKPTNGTSNNTGLRGKVGCAHDRVYGENGKGLLFGKYPFRGRWSAKDPNNPKTTIVKTEINLDKRFKGKGILRKKVIDLLLQGEYHKAVCEVQDFTNCKLKVAREFVNKVKFKYNATHKRTQITVEVP
jgi:hypothetical protein